MNIEQYRLNLRFSTISNEKAYAPLLVTIKWNHYTKRQSLVPSHKSHERILTTQSFAYMRHRNATVMHAEKRTPSQHQPNRFDRLFDPPCGSERVTLSIVVVICYRTARIYVVARSIARSQTLDICSKQTCIVRMSFVCCLRRRRRRRRCLHRRRRCGRAMDQLSFLLLFKRAVFNAHSLNVQSQRL